MTLFVANLLLAIMWYAGVRGGGVGSLLFGFVLGYVVLWWLRPVLGPTPYFEKLPRVSSFLWFFSKELFWANLRVAYDVITPHPQRKPGIIAVPLEPDTTDLELTLLCNLITLTPGSMTMDISADRRVVYVHSMFAHEAQEVRKDVKSFEKQIRRITGRE